MTEQLVLDLLADDMSDAERETIIHDFLGRYSNYTRTAAALRARCCCEPHGLPVRDRGGVSCWLCGRPT